MRRACGLMAGLALVSSSLFAQEPPDATEALKLMADSVQVEVAKLRGWEFKAPVAKDVMSEAELREVLEGRLFDQEYPGDSLQHLEAFLTMVGTVPAGTDLRKTILDVLMNQIGGFYEPEAKTFYMIQREGVEYGPLLDKVLIAHELTHALDDQYVDIGTFSRPEDRTEDLEFALGSVIEGSATALMSRYLAGMMFSGQLDMDQLMKIAESEAERGQAIFEAPPYFRTLLARYNIGMYFMVKGELANVSQSGGGPIVGENLQAAVADPPQSSEQILHLEKYWDAEKRENPVRVVDASAESVLGAAGFRVVARNTAGEIGVACMTTPLDAPFDMMASNMPSAWTNAAATGWGGDRFFLLEPVTLERGAEDGTYRAVWATAWDTPEDRTEFVNLYDATVAREGRRALHFGDRVTVFLLGMTDAEATKTEAALRKSPIAWTQDGQAWN